VKAFLMKTVVILFALLIVTSLITVFPAPVTAQSNSDAQKKAMYFIKNVLPVDLSKYAISFHSESIQDGTPISNDNRKVTSLQYQLTSEDSDLEVNFLIERNTIWSCYIYVKEGVVIPNKQYLGQFDAIQSFFEKYQTYTKIDSSDLLAMLDGVDLTKDSTITTENINLNIKNGYYMGKDYMSVKWTHTIGGVEYTSLELIFDAEGNLISVGDTRVLYSIGDTSVNVSFDEAVDIALDNLQFYSYEMHDGSIVKDFKVGGVTVALCSSPVDYVDCVLRPYYDVRLILEEPAPGSVFGITVFIWANTGEIIKFGNMASGGLNYVGDDGSVDVVVAQNRSTLIMGVVVIVVMAVMVTGVVVVKKRR